MTPDEQSYIKCVSSCVSGNFGQVYEGMLQKELERIKIAAKTLKPSMGSGNIDVKKVEEFLSEATIMQDFQHENVLTLLAVAIKDNLPFVILPFMANGDLRTYVSNTHKVSVQYFIQMFF